MTGCNTPARELHALAREQGFEALRIDARGFRLSTFDNARGAEARARESGILHVYLEGDGTPWLKRTIISNDPTPRRPLMLKLMSIDSADSVYVGRPCYNGSARDSGCDNELWTFARYSSTVVASMADAIQRLARERNSRELWLFGHSGGGAIAMLLAEKLPGVTRVVTVAGNLDTDAWTDHHRYTPLYSSLNPASRPPLRESVWQWHLLGSNDKVIPPALVRAFIDRQPNASGFLFGAYGHGCCWVDSWPSVLEALERDDPSLVPAMQFKRRERVPVAIAQGNP